MSLIFALFRHSRKVLHTGSILSQRRDIVLVDKVDLVVFAACVQTLEIICDLKCLVNIRRITQLGKGFYNIELAVCKNILAPAAADDKTIVLAALLDDRICIMQNRTVIRSAEPTIAQKQDIADLFDFLMGLYEAILQS